MQKNSINIPPYHYIHVLNKNKNVTELIEGPRTFIKQDHEEITTGENPIKMIILPPRTYCQISNPVMYNKEKQLLREDYGQVKVKYGEIELRFAEDYQDPFALYPKEELSLQPTELKIIRELEALKIEATRNFQDQKGNKRLAGDQYIVAGPVTYKPRIEEKIIETVKSQIIGKQQALRLKAKKDLTNSDGKQIKTGEEWLIREMGEYLPKADEIVVELQSAQIINNKQCIQLKAVQQFKDIYGVDRKAGEEWLVTEDLATSHIVDVYEQLVKSVNITVLSKQQYAVIINPFDKTTGKNKLGQKALIKGEKSFFLMPGELIEDRIKDINLLENHEALLLRANAETEVSVNDKDEKTGKITNIKKIVKAGDIWMEYGPTEYIPPLEVEILERRKLIPLDQNEGIYVRDITKGNVRAVVGQSYMLKANEQLFDLELDAQMEQLLKKENALTYNKSTKEREKYRVISYKIPFNTAVQVFDFKLKETRVVFGPELVILQPDEQFTVLSLSGGNPKKEGKIQCLNLLMGPTFSSDTIVVETSDHAQLSLQLAYNWMFDINRKIKEETEKIFKVKDPIGDLCNLMASAIRQAVAHISFEEFHKTSARLVRKSIFGENELGKINKFLFLEKNSMKITNVDIKNIEPVDPRTRGNLKKTVTMAIEITTNQQEAKARNEAQKADQEAKGTLQIQTYNDQAKAEDKKKNLFELQAQSKTILNLGEAIADAKARVEAETIIVESMLKNATLKSKAKQIEFNANLKRIQDKQRIILEHEKNLSELELKKQNSIAEIESKKFQQMIESVGKQTIVEISNAGPEMQAKLLEGLGLQGFIMTNGNNPINLFNSASSLVGQNNQNQTQ